MVDHEEGEISERALNLIKTLNVARRVIKNLLKRPNENKCKILKKSVRLLNETIFVYDNGVELFKLFGFKDTEAGLEISKIDRPYLIDCLKLLPKI